jgi:hypothetical protein
MQHILKISKAVKGKPSEELETTTTASSLLHATRLKKPIVTI